VWVLNENYLPGWLDHEAESLAEEKLKIYAAALARYVRQG